MKQIEFKPIEEKTMNDRLVNLYGSNLVGLYTAVEPLYKMEGTEKPALPLLLELNEKDGKFPYEEADIKVMVFGRENNNWNDTKRRNGTEYTGYTYNFNLQTNEDILNEIRGRHDNLSAGEKEVYGICDIYHDYCYEDTGVAKNQFTQRMNRFVELLRNRMGTKKVETIWNNVSKIGLCRAGFGGSCGQPTAQIKDIEKSRFNVVAEEVRILKPDIVIFMTGVEADGIIREKFGLPEDGFTPVRESMFLHRVNLPGVKYAARTIHPVRKSNTELEEYYNALTDDILSNYKK